RALRPGAADLSLGANGLLFSILRTAFSVTGSLRSPARVGVLVLLSIAVLAAIGAAGHLRRRAPVRAGVRVVLSIAVLAAIGAARTYRRWPRFAPMISLALTLLCLGEYWSS